MKKILLALLVLFSAQAMAVGPVVVDKCGVGPAIVSKTTTALSVSSGVATNIVTMVLPCSGDWEVFGAAATTRSSGGTRSLTTMISSINEVSLSLPASEYFGIYDTTAAINSENLSVPVPSRYFQVSGAKTVYLVVQVTFSGTTSTVTGQLHARKLK